MTEEQSESLGRLAEIEDVSPAERIRRSADSYTRARRDVGGEERKRRLLSVAGIGHSGVSDLALNHDKYLAEIYAEHGTKSPVSRG